MSNFFILRECDGAESKMDIKMEQRSVVYLRELEVLRFQEGIYFKAA